MSSPRKRLIILATLGVVLLGTGLAISRHLDLVMDVYHAFVPRDVDNYIVPGEDIEILQFTPHVLPILRTNCLRCHGEEEVKGGLILGGGDGIARGGEHGPVVVPGNLEESLLWQRIVKGEMPPDEPLSEAEQSVLREWIERGAVGVPKITWETDTELEEAEYEQAWLDHWAFQPPGNPRPPRVEAKAQTVSAVSQDQVDGDDADQQQVKHNEIDRFVLARLQEQGLTLSAEADRRTLIRRVSFDLTGLPPTLTETSTFLEDQEEGAYERMVEHYLRSPHYGERWGQHWLDVAGYSDSGGPVGTDLDRTLAWQYRDYVIRSFNADKPFDKFVREQLAGDEISNYHEGEVASPETVELLTATHFLRNGPDPTEDSCGNGNEFRDDRYVALDNAMRITTSALLGLTMHCAKCHNHRLEPITQEDYYRTQAVFYPAYNVENWFTPIERVLDVPLLVNREGLTAHREELAARVDQLRKNFSRWVWENRPLGDLVFADEFDGLPQNLADTWQSVAVGRKIRLNSERAPGAILKGGQLNMIHANSAMQGVLATKRSFDWTPDKVGQWIQVTFDLIDNKVSPDQVPTRALAYFLSVSPEEFGRASDSYAVMFLSRQLGGVRARRGYTGGLVFPSRIGTSPYLPGSNFGLRITNIGKGKFQIEHLRDWTPEPHQLVVDEADLPDGAFGFRFHRGQSCIVDNLAVETGNAKTGSDKDKLHAGFEKEYRERMQDLQDRVSELQESAPDDQATIPWITDISPHRPHVHLLVRGDNTRLGPEVQPGTFSFLSAGESDLEIKKPAANARTTGTRLAWVNWLTTANSPQAALMARTQANRIWLHHFGTGLVSSSENMGVSGDPPSHPELLEWLAVQFMKSKWSVKELHRLILNSATYRQSSTADEQASAADPQNRLLWRYPLRRLDAESVRDGMLLVSGELDREFGGPTIPTHRMESGEIMVASDDPGGLRRSIYLHHRRSQTTTLMNVFDAPIMTLNCLGRRQSTTPLQPLALLNSAFCVQRAQRMAEGLGRQAEIGDAERVRRAFELAIAREPTPAEMDAAMEFIQKQKRHYVRRKDAVLRTWTDFCQSLLASNAFLYLR